jgi:hypothetical protein
MINKRNGNIKSCSYKINKTNIIKGQWTGIYEKLINNISIISKIK